MHAIGHAPATGRNRCPVDRAPRWRLRLHPVRSIGVVVAVVTVGVATAACAGTGATRAASRASHELHAQDASITLLDGATTTLSAYRGAPTLVWFVAAGCASCEASIPVVAEHLGTFAEARTRILVLALYGAFGTGAEARSELRQFGQAAAGAAFSDPTWTWGLASATLTTAYDPDGVPDDYFLLDAAGRTVYRGSVPVSTMQALLANLRALTGVTQPAPSTRPSSTVSVLP